MDRSKKLLENEKGALLCFFLLAGIFVLSTMISAKIAVGSGMLEDTILLDRSSAIPTDAKELLRILCTAAVRFSPTAATAAIMFMLADSTFFFPVSAAVVIVRGAVFGISVAGTMGVSEILQVVFYGSVSLLLLILISYTVGTRMSLPDNVKPQRYLIEAYLIFSGLGGVGEFLLPLIL